MSDQESPAVTPPATQESTMEAPPAKEATAHKPSQLSFSIWPPAERTREAVVNRLIETLSTPSVLSNRYGTIPQDEASAAARLIEEEAFSTAAASAEDDGIQILQVYSKEISKRMLDAVKARAAASGSATADAASTPETEATPTSSAVDDSKVESESS